MIITAAMLDLSSVTPEMIGRAHKAFEVDGTAFYLVESSRGLIDNEGQAVEYKVTWSKKYGFRCTCPSGQRGFANCGAKKVCQHVLSSVAAANEEKEAVAALSAKVAQPTRAHYLEANGQEVSDKEYARVMLAKGQDSRKAPSPDVYNRKPFSLMK